MNSRDLDDNQTQAWLVFGSSEYAWYSILGVEKSDSFHGNIRNLLSFSWWHFIEAERVEVLAALAKKNFPYVADPHYNAAKRMRQGKKGKVRIKYKKNSELINYRKLWFSIAIICCDKM